MKRLGFNVFLDDGFRGDAGSTIGVPGQRRALTGLSGSCPAVKAGGPRVLCMLLTPRLTRIFRSLSAFIVLQRAFVKLKLVLNAGKTRYMFFSRSCKKYHDFCIHTSDGAIIDRVPTYKYLGISFHIHVDELNKIL